MSAMAAGHAALRPLAAPAAAGRSLRRSGGPLRRSAARHATSGDAPAAAPLESRDEAGLPQREEGAGDAARAPAADRLASGVRAGLGLAGRVALLSAIVASVGAKAAFARRAPARETPAAPLAASALATPARDTGLLLAAAAAPPAADKDAAKPAAPLATAKAAPAAAAQEADPVVTTGSPKPKLPDLFSYTRFLELLQSGGLSRVKFLKDKASLLATVASDGAAHRVLMPYDPMLSDLILASGVDVEVEDRSIWDAALSMADSALTPLLTVGALAYIFKEGTKARRDDMGELGGLRVKPGQMRTTLDDVAGIEAIRGEVEELVGYARNADKFLAMGARLPAGVLLVGPPGTGKTLLAKAIAGEAGVPFFAASGSEFTEMYAGVGAARIRSLFQTARKVAPCIVFIDEFDALGASRKLSGSNLGGSSAGNEEAANLVNQMLTEMDGFEDNRGIMILAATNRPGVLDEALTRPGRFDRKLLLPLPGLAGRAAILQLHARNKRIAPGVDWRRVARACGGMTGADLENVVNTAATVASRALAAAIRAGDVPGPSLVQGVIEGLRLPGTTAPGGNRPSQPGLGAAVDAGAAAAGSVGDITEELLLDTVFRMDRDAATLRASGSSEVVSGDADANVAAMSPDLRRSVASYEAGKALAGLMTPFYDELQKVVVFPGGNPVGHTYFLPREAHLESGIMTRGYMESHLVVLLAGRCAEVLLMGPDKVSGRAATDLKAAADMARQMVMRYGFNKTLGPVSLLAGGTDHAFLGKARPLPPVEMSADLAQQAADEVTSLLEAAEAKAFVGLRRNATLLESLTQALLARRALSGGDVATLAAESGTRVREFESVFLSAFAVDADGRPLTPGPEAAALAAGGGVLGPGGALGGGPADAIAGAGWPAPVTAGPEFRGAFGSMADLVKLLDDPAALAGASAALDSKLRAAPGGEAAVGSDLPGLMRLLAGATKRRGEAGGR